MMRTSRLVLLAGLTLGASGCGYNRIQALDEQVNRAEGQIAAQMLLERITGRANIARREQILDCELIVRESSGSKRR